jgi:iron(III) transport system permease protein
MSAAIAVAAALLALLPLLSLVVIAFGETGDLWDHLIRHVIPAALAKTTLLLVGVAAVTIVLGAGTAYLVSTFSFPGRDTLAWLLPLPLAIPTYIVAYIYVDLLDALGPLQSILPNVRSLGGAIVLFGLVLYPYVYLAVRAMLQTQGAMFTEPARMLGARPWQLARRITLPLARPAIAVGVSLALLETLNDIGACEYLGVPTLTLSIFTTWLNRGSLAGAAQIACLLLLIVAALIALERTSRRRDFAVSAQDVRRVARITLTGPARWVAAGACLAPVVFGFILPAGYLLREAIARSLFTAFDADIVRHALTTVLLAAMATVATLALGFAAVAAWRWVRHPVVAASIRIAGIGYAVPGTVLALGLLSPLVLVDEAINALARAFGHRGVGLILAGSLAAPVIAYVIRYLAIALGFAEAGFARIASELDEVARMLGAGPGRLARTIHLPLIRPAVSGAALLIFVDCLKELPATLLLRPLNVETLATYIYQFASRGSFEDGALAALIIVAVGIAPVIFITRHADAIAGHSQNLHVRASAASPGNRW